MSKPEVPPDLIFFVTSRCNACCEYCHFKKQILDSERKKHELSIEEIIKIAYNYGQLSKLSLCGGEPYIRKDLPEIVQAFVDHCAVRIVDIPTNGSLTKSIVEQTGKILERNPDLVLEIQMSIDGPEEVHDKLRGFPSLYKKALQTLKELEKLRKRHKNLRIKMNCIYQEGNQDTIFKMAKEFEQEYPFDRFQIIYPHGIEELKARIQKLSYEKFYIISREIQLHMHIRNRLDLHSLLFRAIKILRDKVLLNVLERYDMGNICHAGSHVGIIDDVGEVYPCEPLWESVGNLRKADYSMQKILNGELMKQFRCKHLGSGKCHCTWLYVALDNIIFTPRYYPMIMYYMLYLFFLGGWGLQSTEANHVKD